MTNSRPPVLAAAALGLCIAVGPFFAGYFIYRGILEAKLGDRYVTAKGLVEKVEKADRGSWEIGFKVSGNDLNQLYSKVSEVSNLIQEFAKKEDFEAQEIMFGAPRVTDLYAREYGPETRPPERYIIEQSIFVNSFKVDKLNTLSAKTGSLISQGVPVARTDTRFYLDKFNELRPKLVEEATKNAQEVAESFAKTTGSQIGGIRTANQGVIRMTSPDSSPNQDYDEGLNSLMKKIRVVTTIEFYLK
jgi:hypothetical protein